MALNSGSLGPFAVWGFVPWSNLSATGIAKAQGVRCLGIRFVDPNAFIASRSKVAQNDIVVIGRWSRQSGRIIVALPSLIPFGKFIGLLMVIIGYSGLPKSADEPDILARMASSHPSIDDSGRRTDASAIDREEALGGFDDRSARRTSRACCGSSAAAYHGSAAARARRALAQESDQS